MKQRRLDLTLPPGTQRVRGRASWLAAALACATLASAWPAADATAGAYFWRGGPGPGPGFVVRGPLFWPLVAPWPYYYGPRGVVVQGGPTEYVENGASGAEFEQGGDWWYYCRKPKGYYPKVERCPGGWEKVPPGGQP